MKSGEKVEQIQCRCGWSFRKAEADFVRVEPIEIRVDCDQCKAKGEAKCKPLDDDDWALYHRIEAEDIPHWYPKDVRFRGDEPKRNEKRGITHPCQMFSRRNLRALSVIWHCVGQPSAGTPIGDWLCFVFTSIVFLSSLMSRWRYSGGGVGGTIGIRAGTLYIPSLIRDLNVVNLYENKTRRLFDDLRLLNSGRSSFVHCGDATRLPLPDASSDYAYYDPPYGNNINYSELNIMWEAWLGEFTEIEREIVENNYQHKGRAQYESMMTAALQESYRVLKPGRWLTVVYSYSDASMYRTVQRMAHEAGFVDEGEVLYVNSTSKTKAMLDSDKTQQRYLVINFYKPHNGERKALIEAEHFEDEVVRAIDAFLRDHPGVTRDHIYDECIRRTFSETQIEGFDLEALLAQDFQPLGDGWQTVGSLMQPSEARLVEESAKDVREVMWACQQHLAEHGTVPIHQFREFYQIKLNTPAFVEFDDLLASFKVEGGRVRLPTDAEQEQLADINRLRTRRHIRRVVEGKDLRYVEDKTLCEWIGFCYREEMFDEAVTLFPLINDTQLDADAYRATEDVVKVCRKRLKETGESEKPAQRTPKTKGNGNARNGGLFE